MTELTTSDFPWKTAVVAGFAAYLYFHRREPTSVPEYGLLLAGIPVTLGYSFHQNLAGFSLLQSILASSAVYLIVLIASTIAYRLSPFHPLAGYPGPFMAKITRFWALQKTIQGKAYLQYYDLHKRYGDVVRTGPNHLSIRDVKAVPVVLGPGASHERWRRGRRYGTTSIPGSAGSILGIVSPAEHSYRRRIWDRAFTPNALQEYEQMIQNRVGKLVRRLRDSERKVVDLGFWLGCFGVDFMGDLAFAGAFNFLEGDDDDNGFQKALSKGSRDFELLGTIPWIKPFWNMVHEIATGLNIFQIASEVLEDRKRKEVKRKDLFFHLLDEDGSSGHEPLSDATLYNDAAIALIAGSDTTSVAATNVFYYLLSNPDILALLRRELDNNIAAEVEYADMTLLTKLPLLNAVINETLRLQPAVPSGSQRVPPESSGGSPSLAGQIIVPPHTTVQIPAWALHRDPRYFWPHPESFHPDRWLVDPKTKTHEEFRLEKMAFIPFSYGPQHCVGKQLAMNELRLVVSTLVRNFNFQVAPGWDLRNWEEGLTAAFILEKSNLLAIPSARRE